MFVHSIVDWSVAEMNFTHTHSMNKPTHTNRYRAEEPPPPGRDPPTPEQVQSNILNTVAKELFPFMFIREVRCQLNEGVRGVLPGRNLPRFLDLRDLFLMTVAITPGAVLRCKIQGKEYVEVERARGHVYVHSHSHSHSYSHSHSRSYVCPYVARVHVCKRTRQCTAGHRSSPSFSPFACFLCRLRALLPGLVDDDVDSVGLCVDSYWYARRPPLGAPPSAANDVAIPSLSIRCILSCRDEDIIRVVHRNDLGCVRAKPSFVFASTNQSTVKAMPV